MKLFHILYGFALLGLVSLQSCSISLSGVQVPVEVNTFNVGYISNSARIVVPSLSQEVTDQITQKVLRETRLKLNTENPDVEFTGEIIDYAVASEAPTSGQTTTLNRLDIVIKIEYTNSKNEEDNWSNTFRNFSNFDPSESLVSVQDELIEIILKDIVEDIYQKAFTNW